MRSLSARLVVPLVLVPFVLLPVACAPDAPANPGPGPSPGTVGGICRQDGSCDEGLRCDGERCVTLADDDAGPGGDGGDDAGALDAGPGDGGTGDAGEPTDSGLSDAGPDDSGPGDGGTGDGGTGDGGLTDGGLTDAGTGGLDAGAADAGFDAGAGPVPCQRNADCTGNLRCGLVDDNGALATQCVTPPGASLPGAACMNDADCNSGLCLDGFCSAPCLSEADCGADQVCRTEMITVGSASGALDLCVTLPDLACATNDVCAADGRVCGDVRFGVDPLTAYCALPSVDGAAFGESCAGSTALNEQCEDLLCLHDRCTRMCVDDADCAGAASGYGCSDVTFTGGGLLRMCVDVCARDGDCTDPTHLCRISVDNTDDELEWICRAPTQMAPPGTACPITNSCDHGVCIRTRDAMGTVVDSYCSLPCETAADCPAELPVCEDATFSRPASGDPQTLRVCGKP